MLRRSLAVPSLLLSLGLCLAVGHAQDGKKRGFALLVGVKDYDDASLDTLQFTENDVEELAKLIDVPGSPFHGNVRLLTTTRGRRDGNDLPTGVNIRTALAKLVKGRTRHDLVLVAMSGHGVQLIVSDPKGVGKDRSYGYFCPKDADLKGVKYETGQHERLVLLPQLFEALGDCGAGAKLVLMDACRNELRASGRSLKVNRELVPEGVAALFSCKTGQVAFEADKLGHGVFFYHVLQGLRGEARNLDGEVTWNSLADYVSKEVPLTVKKLARGEEQTPNEIKNLAIGSLVLRAPVGGEGKAEKEKVVKGWGKEVENSVGMKFVRVGPGKFTMGSPKDEEGRHAEAQHEVEITREFWLGVYEVTQAEYGKVMGDHTSWFSAAGGGKEMMKGVDTRKFPVERVSWQEARSFCERLSALPAEQKAGRKYRLPSEAEWEYACRGGATTYSVFHTGNALSSALANFNGNYPYGGAEKGRYLERPCEVGSYRPNAFGLFDMHGNVWEWCEDWYSADYYSKGPRRDPQGPSQGSDRVARGGSWFCDGRLCRSSRRGKFEPGYRARDVGFRVAVVRADK